MTEVVVIVGHPRPESFCEALGRAYVEGASEAGHRAELIALSRLRFDPVLHGGFEGDQEIEPDLRSAQEAIKRAEHLVFVWPLWLGMPPALLKGFLERIFITPGFAVERAPPPTLYKPLLGGRSARIVVTMQMPALYYRFVAGARAVRTFRYNILEFVGIKPVRRTLFGMVDMVNDATRKGWIEEMRRLGRKAA